MLNLKVNKFIIKETDFYYVLKIDIILFNNLYFGFKQFLNNKINV